MKLSIITINYNNAAGLAQTIQSVITQTFRDFEYIIIDGGSTDDSVGIIKQNVPHIQYWVSEKDKGIYNAMNKGLQVAKGEYIQFLNSGDCLYGENALALLADKLNGTDIVYGDAIVYINKKSEIRRHFSELTLLGLLERSRHLCHQAVFMTRKSIDEAGGTFDESIKLLSDWRMIARAIIKNQASYLHFPEIVISYDLNGESAKEESLLLIKQEHLKILKEDYPLFYTDFIKINTNYGITYTELTDSPYFRLLIKLKRALKT